MLRKRKIQRLEGLSQDGGRVGLIYLYTYIFCRNRYNSFPVCVRAFVQSPFLVTLTRLANRRITNMTQA